MAYYWSATADASKTGDNIWGVIMRDGKIGASEVLGEGFVWVVRGQPYTRFADNGDDTVTDKLTGEIWPQRFTDNKDGTVTDNLTGLAWLKDAGCLGLATWGFANDGIESLNSGQVTCDAYTETYQDWRLPTVQELSSVINAKGLEGIKDEKNLSKIRDNLEFIGSQDSFMSMFLNFQPAYAWSSTERFNTQSWFVDMSNGFVGAYKKSEKCVVWSVRDGVAAQTKDKDEEALPAKESQPLPRFENNGDGTVLDNLTGLTWLQQANCAGLKMNRDEALTAVTELNSRGTMNDSDCGDAGNAGSYQTDWRLPEVDELQSLIDYDFYNPAVPNTTGLEKWTEGKPFAGLQTDYYWSATPGESSTGDSVWGVVMRDGEMGASQPLGNGYVWAVRGEQYVRFEDNGDGTATDKLTGKVWPPPPSKYTDNGDGTVTDNLTGLIWLKDTDCLGELDLYFAGETIGQAADFSETSLNSGQDFDCEGYKAGTYDDWRLPTLQELTSVINVDGHGVDNNSPSRGDMAGFIGSEMDFKSTFLDLQSTAYWSSTPSTFRYQDQGGAWDVNLLNGFVSRDTGNQSSWVWPVRARQKETIEVTPPDTTSNTTSGADPDRIMLYTSGRIHPGNLGGLDGANTLCRESQNKPDGYSNFRAFISVDADNEIRDMPARDGIPTDRAIWGRTGKIADDWADMLDGSINMSLVDAGVGRGDIRFPGYAWWSGSDGSAGGAVATAGGSTCSGWTDGSEGRQTPHNGKSRVSDERWLWFDNNGYSHCSDKRFVVCIAW